MVKFGKYFRQHQIPKWDKDYIDYKSLKQRLKEMIGKINSHNEQALLRKENENEIIFEGHPKRDLEEGIPSRRSSSNQTENNPSSGNEVEIAIMTPTSNALKEELEGLYKMPNGKLFKQFTQKMDQELRKMYRFYLSTERDLFLKLNTHLHVRDNISKLNIWELFSETEALYGITVDTKLFCSYINLNMESIKRILKKVDKKLKPYYGKTSLSLKYLRTKLENTRSDLNYILQFKIIDELSSLLDDLCKDIIMRLVTLHEMRHGTDTNSSGINSTKSFAHEFPSTVGVSDFNAYRVLLAPEIDNNNSVTNKTVEDIINNKDEKLFYSACKEKIKYFISEIKESLCHIDESNTFRTKYKNWGYYFRYGVKVNPNSSFISLLKKDDDAGSVLINRNLDEEMVIKKFIPPSALEAFKKQNEALLSNDNNANIILCLFHCFLSMLNYSLCLSTNSSYVFALGVNPYFSGIVLGATHVGVFISAIFCTRILSGNKYYRICMILSTILMSLGNLAYACAGSIPQSGIEFLNIQMIIMTFGRLLIGLGSGRVINRKYILQFVSKPLLKKYSTLISFATILGFATGPAMCVAIESIPNYKLFDIFDFNTYTFPGYIGFIISFILLILIIISFTDPNHADFSILKIRSRTNSESISSEKAAGGEKKVVIHGKLSKEENKLIKETNEKLREMNTSNKFSDSNLIPENINKAILYQKTNKSYIYKCFIILFFTQMTIHCCNESLIVIFAFYMHDLNGFNQSTLFISMYMALSLLGIVPIGSFVNAIIKKRLRERRILIYIELVSIVCGFLIFNLICKIMAVYLVSFSVLIISLNLIDKYSSSLLSKVMPPEWEFCGFNAGMMVSIFTTICRLAGSLMLCTGFLVGIDNIHFLTYGICCLMLLILVILSYAYYSDLRVKAIARIMKKNLY